MRPLQLADYPSPHCAVNPCTACPAGSHTTSLRASLCGLDAPAANSVCIGSHGQRFGHSRVTGVQGQSTRDTSAGHVSLHLHSSPSKDGRSLRISFVHESIRHSLVSAKLRLREQRKGAGEDGTVKRDQMVEHRAGKTPFVGR